jgi:SAM-dependent methyltransferase
VDFRIKNLLQTLFSSLPQGEQINYLFQRWVSKSLPPSEGRCQFKTEIAKEHYNNFLTYHTLENFSKKYYEFGAGWDLMVPLIFSQYGFECSVYDIRRLVKLNLINHSLAFIQKEGMLNKSTTSSKISDLSDLERAFKVKYFAPFDAKKTSFKENTFDFSSSTFVLEHIPKDDIHDLLAETYRILKSGGILSIRIDYKDHWAYFDQTITPYNFLKYSSKEWKKYNPALHYQNRMRHAEYMAIIQKIGFEVVKEEVETPDKNLEHALLNLPIHKDFNGFQFDDLKVLSSKLILRK